MNIELEIARAKAHASLRKLDRTIAIGISLIVGMVLFSYYLAIVI